ncbi:hypothetical protein STEG23_032867, partial [Scotinomys teguina]
TVNKNVDIPFMPAFPSACFCTKTDMQPQVLDEKHRCDRTVLAMINFVVSKTESVFCDLLAAAVGSSPCSEIICFCVVKFVLLTGDKVTPGFIRTFTVFLELEKRLFSNAVKRRGVQRIRKYPEISRKYPVHHATAAPEEKQRGAQDKGSNEAAFTSAEPN